MEIASMSKNNGKVHYSLHILWNIIPLLKIVLMKWRNAHEQRLMKTRI